MVPMLRAIVGDPLGRAAEHLAQELRDLRAQHYGHHLNLNLDMSGFSLVSTARGASGDLPPVRLPDSIQATWTRDGRSARHLDFDAYGHALDTEITLRQGNRDLMFSIDGLTGRWTPRTRP